MKAWLISLICISLSLMCAFACVGYAVVSGSVYVKGTVTAEPPKIIFITNVNGGNYINPNTLAYTGTIINSDLTLRQNSIGTYEASYTFTVFNNTDDTYYYVAMVRGTSSGGSGEIDSYSNPNIELNPDILLGEEIKPGETRVVKVTANFSKGADTSNTTLHSIIEYQFSTTKPESNDQAAVSGVLGKFAEILNNNEDYNDLISAMDNTAGIGGILTGRVSDTYIGNVVGSESADTEALNALFGENMELNIDGVNTPVTIMIKRENIDGNKNTGDGEGNEMTLYITADPLNVTGKYVPVYAVVYTKKSGTDWHQIGDIYMGTANVRSYGGISIRGTGSFNTDNWRRVDANGNRVNNDTIENIIKSLS